MSPRVNADATLGEKLGVVLYLGVAGKYDAVGYDSNIDDMP
jgi:hypothetical protein